MCPNFSFEKIHDKKFSIFRSNMSFIDIQQEIYTIIAENNIKIHQVQNFTFVQKKKNYISV